MARRELRRKITATVLTVTALCCLLGVCAWLLLGSNVFSDTIRIMMLVCTVVLGVATIGLLVAKVQEIRALREIIRSEDAQQQSEAETPRPELAPLQTLDHTTIELPPLPDIPAPAAQPAPKQAKQQPKTKQGRSKKRGRAMEQPAAETMAPAQPVLQPIEVVPPTPVAPPRPVQQAPQPEQPSVERKWKPIDFNAAMQQRLAEEAAARQRAIEAAAERPPRRRSTFGGRGPPRRGSTFGGRGPPRRGSAFGGRSPPCRGSAFGGRGSPGRGSTGRIGSDGPRRRGPHRGRCACICDCWADGRGCNPSLLGRAFG